MLELTYSGCAFCMSFVSWYWLLRTLGVMMLDDRSAVARSMSVSLFCPKYSVTRLFASTTGSSGRNSSVLVLRLSVGRSEANPAVMSMMMTITTTG